MYYQTKELVSVAASIYREGMEDGTTKVDSSVCMGCQDSCGFCNNYKPYINTSWGRVFISCGDYIVYDEHGRRHVIKRDLFEQ